MFLMLRSQQIQHELIWLIIDLFIVFFFISNKFLVGPRMMFNTVGLYLCNCGTFQIPKYKVSLQKKSVPIQEKKYSTTHKIVTCDLLWTSYKGAVLAG